MAAAPPSPPTHSDPAGARKANRLWLYGPFAALAVVAALWSLAWIWMMHEAQGRLDAGAAALRKAGWAVAWDSRHVGGYPFRLDIDVANLRVADPSGWAFATRTLKSEAYAFLPTRWVFYLPDGLAFVRPDGGAVRVDARVVRGSVNGWDQSPPRISIDGDGLSFTAAPGAKPFALAAAKDVQIYTRSGPNDQAAVFVSVDGGVAAPGGWVDRIAGGGPVALKLDGVLSHTQYLHGASWRGLVGGWSAGGGTFDVHQLAASAGVAELDVDGGGVAVGADGRLVGVLESRVKQPDRLLAVLSGDGKAASSQGIGDPKGVAISARLTFRDGETWLGPLKLAPAPRLY
ncbi:MAG TPA: DUF2125 domain-containing protein [Caulobacteraceae bacterium]